MQPLTEELKVAVNVLREAQLDCSAGMPEELFLMISAMVPLANVDLLVTNNRNQILLSRRNDGFFQKSWHIPGGCMRYGETFEDRIRETALREFGTNVCVQKNPITVKNVIRGKNDAQRFPNERGHNVAILFKCTFEEDFAPDKYNEGKTEEDDGFLKWFDVLPDDFMEIQKVYADVLKEWTRMEE